MIVRVNVDLNGTVVFDNDWRYYNLCVSHVQSQSELYHVSWRYETLVIDLAPVSQKLDSATHWINHYQKDKC